MARELEVSVVEYPGNVEAWKGRKVVRIIAPVGEGMTVIHLSPEHTMVLVDKLTECAWEAANMPPEMMRALKERSGAAASRIVGEMLTPPGLKS